MPEKEEIELQDVVNDQDEVVDTMPRGEVWEKGLQSHTRVVNVFIFNEKGELLLPVRSMKKSHWPGCYDFSFAENLHAGEDYSDALFRGAREELGLEITDHQELAYRTPPQDGEFCFMKVYEVKLKSDFEFHLDPDEVDRVDWKPLAEIKELAKASPEKFKKGYPELLLMIYSTRT